MSDFPVDPLISALIFQKTAWVGRNGIKFSGCIKSGCALEKFMTE